MTSNLQAALSTKHWHSLPLYYALNDDIYVIYIIYELVCLIDDDDIPLGDSTQRHSPFGIWSTTVWPYKRLADQWRASRKGGCFSLEEICGTMTVWRGYGESEMRRGGSRVYTAIQLMLIVKLIKTLATENDDTTLV